MIKQLIIIIQLLGLFFYQLIFTGDLAVTQKIANSLVQGEEALVEITINKEDITGFAKVQQTFPEGFTAEPVETKGATFSFKDNKVKFIWMALPTEKEFTISYKLTPNKNTEGNFNVGGKFSFIADSERKNIDIPVANFSVGTEALVADATPIDPVVEDEVTTEMEEPEVETETTTIEILTVKCKRTIENIEGRKYKVTLEIDKKGVEGFAKINEIIPDGFIARENDSKDGVFSFKNNEVKILWMAVPKETVYTVSYNIEAEETTSNGNYSIKGHYSYLDNEETRKYDIDGSGFKLNVEAIIAEETIVDEPEEVAIVDEEETVSEPVVVEKVEEEITQIKEPEIEAVEETVEEPIVADNSNDITSTPGPEHNITYKVQVGAGHKKVPSTYFKTKFKLKDKINTMNHEGWIKYLVGSFNEYRGAQMKRDVVKSNVKTAFVTAYNAGTRITVQEALMISRQKWYK